MTTSFKRPVYYDGIVFHLLSVFSEAILKSTDTKRKGKSVRVRKNKQLQVEISSVGALDWLAAAELESSYRLLDVWKITEFPFHSNLT